MSSISSSITVIVQDDDTGYEVTETYSATITKNNTYKAWSQSNAGSFLVNIYFSDTYTTTKYRTLYSSSSVEIRLTEEINY